jgi:hypothetical protein
MQSTELFREEFRTTVPADYSGVQHGLLLLAIGVVTIGACAWFLAPPLQWYDWAMVPLVVAGWNLLEWWGHLKVLHRPGKSAFTRALYTRHALTHHRFFTQEDSDLRDARDLKIVFFPLFALPGMIVLTGIPAVLLGFLLSRNAGLVVMITMVAMYLLFEAFHLLAHVPSTVALTRLPLVALMRRHHRDHHDQAIMMSHNMNFTLPLADWWLGTWHRGEQAPAGDKQADRTA